MFVFWSKFCQDLVNKILYNGITSCELKSLLAKSGFLTWKLRWRFPRRMGWERKGMYLTTGKVTVERWLKRRTFI